MSDLQRLFQAVREYCSRYHILQFEISDRYELQAQWKTDYFPHTERCGCYAFFDGEMRLIYIGKASCGSSIGSRLGTYHNWPKDSETLMRTGSSHWNLEPAFIHTIPVHEAHQAPSLEEYLIERLSPPANRVGG